MDSYALAHGIHYAIVGSGVVGIAVILAPAVHERLAGVHTLRPARAPRDVHEARVLRLRVEIAAGGLGTPAATRTPALPAPEATLPVAARLLVPVAFVGSTAAAGVHAAMAPSHLGHGWAFGVFFIGCSLFQLGWAGALAMLPSRGTLAVGAAANLVVIGLWAVTRSVGLPVLMPQPEAVGPWDVACVAWQLVVVAACLRLLASPAGPPRLAPWHRWDGRATGLTVGSAALLSALSLGGFGG